MRDPVLTKIYRLRREAAKLERDAASAELRRLTGVVQEFTSAESARFTVCVT